MSPRAPSSMRLAALLVFAGLAVFIGLYIAAAVTYPGGTFCDASASRYRFWGNYVCDLTQPRSQLGLDNARAARLATASFAAIAVAFVPFWWLVGAFVRRGARVAVRVPGLLSAVATFAVGLVPSGRWHHVHAALVFTATIPGLAAAVVGTLALQRARRRTAAALGALTLLLAFIDAVGYAHAVLAGSRCNPVLPVVQKLAAIALVAWMVVVAAAGLGGAGSAERLGGEEGP